jgi:hypothetical protein
MDRIAFSQGVDGSECSQLAGLDLRWPLKGSGVRRHGRGLQAASQALTGAIPWKSREVSSSNWAQWPLRLVQLRCVRQQTVEARCLFSWLVRFRSSCVCTRVTRRPPPSSCFAAASVESQVCRSRRLLQSGVLARGKKPCLLTSEARRIARHHRDRMATR